MSERYLENVDIDAEVIQAFCRRWHVIELSLFGSVLRADFGPKSDVDLLVEFEAGSGTSLFDLVAMRDELAQIFGREVDLVEKAGLTNPFRRAHILQNRSLLYAA